VELDEIEDVSTRFIGGRTRGQILDRLCLIEDGVLGKCGGYEGFGIIKSVWVLEKEKG
jgi:hypothetical protein